jgi:hypothetical protein
MNKPVLLTCILIIAAPCGLWALGNDAKNRARVAREAREAKSAERAEQREEQRRKAANRPEKMSSMIWKHTIWNAKNGVSYWFATDSSSEASHRRREFYRASLERGLPTLVQYKEGESYGDFYYRTGCRKAYNDIGDAYTWAWYAVDMGKVSRHLLFTE